MSPLKPCPGPLQLNTCCIACLPAATGLLQSRFDPGGLSASSWQLHAAVLFVLLSGTASQSTTHIMYDILYDIISYHIHVDSRYVNRSGCGNARRGFD